MRVSLLLLLVVGALDLSVAGAQDEEAEIVARLVANVDSYRNPPCQFERVDPATIQTRRAWMFRTLDRLEEFIAENPGEDEVRAWREELRLSELRRELSQWSPNARWLKQLRDEDEYYLEMRDKVADLEPDERLFDVTYGGYHIVAAMFRALNRYAEVLDDHQVPQQAQARLNDRLDELKQEFENYRKAEDEAIRAEILVKIHAIIEELEISLQVPELTAVVRSHYLHPKVSLFVSSRVLTKVAGLLPIDPQLVAQSERGTRVQGLATPIGRLFIEGGEGDRLGILQARYAAPVLFNGSAQRSHICLGISARLDASVLKSLFVIQGAPDSARTTSQVRLVSTTSSGGNLVDAVVDRAARRSFDSGRISAVLEDQIDDRVTRAANYINLGAVQEVKRQLKLARVQAIRVRSYRSRNNGIEVTLSSSRQGFQEPDATPPPSFLQEGAGETDFAVSFRRGLARELVGALLPSAQQPAELTPATVFLERALDFVRTQRVILPGTELKVWFPSERQFITFLDGKIKVELNVADADAPQQGYPATIELDPSLVDGGIQITLEIKVPDKPELAEQLRLLLDRFCHVNRIRLPELPIGPDRSITVGELINLNFNVTDEYATLSGELLSD